MADDLRAACDDRANGREAVCAKVAVDTAAAKKAEDRSTAHVDDTTAKEADDRSTAHVGNTAAKKADDRSTAQVGYTAAKEADDRSTAHVDEAAAVAQLIEHMVAQLAEMRKMREAAVAGMDASELQVALAPVDLSIAVMERQVQAMIASQPNL